MNTILQDLRYAVRMLIKRPGFTAVSVLTLALGIGANSAVFSVVNAVLLRPLPFPEPDRLVVAEQMSVRNGSKGGPLSPPDFLDYRSQNQVFTNFAAYQNLSFTVTGDGSESEHVSSAGVSAGFFETLGVGPLAGRLFVRDEEQDGRSNVVILSNSLWQSRYGSDPNIVGKSIALNGNNNTVVAVMPAGFAYPKDVKLWVPIPFKSTIFPQLAVRRYHFLQTIGRLNPGVSVEQAQTDMSRIGASLAEQYPDSNAGIGAGLTPLTEWTVGDMRETLLILLTAVGLVLLIACANVANLSLVRGASRAREIAVRSALGASRFRVIRQLLTESILTALLGGAFGMLIAMWGISVLVSFGPENLPRVKEVSTDWRVLGFTLGISLFTGILFGLAPALTVSKSNLTETLKEGGRGNTSGGRQRLRGLLAVSEIAFSLVLLIGAGLLIKSFANLSQSNPGFKPTNVLTGQFTLPRAGYVDNKQRSLFFQQLIERIEAIPGVKFAGVTSQLPLSGQENDTFFNVDGRPNVAFGDIQNDANIRIVSPDYFGAIGIPLTGGKLFGAHDGIDAPPLVVVNERFVQRFFPNENPLGKRLAIDLGQPQPFDAEIVGVVGSIRHSSLAQIQMSPEMYVSAYQSPSFGGNLVVKGTGDPSQLTSAVRNAVISIDKDLPIYNVKNMESVISESASEPRFRTILLGIFAGAALLLASIGIYGVISYSVTQRTHEIGLRLALGARTSDVLKLVVGQGMVMTLIGIVVGLAGAFAVMRVLTTFLFGVGTKDPLIYVGVSVLLAIVALLACFIPARRATRVDPMVCLRYE